MFAYRLDKAFGICVWYFAGDTNTDADFERYIASFKEADTVAAGLPFPPVAILYVEPQNPMPTAKWRKRMAEESTALKSRPSLAFASPAPIIRGIVTAVNWIRPPPFDFKVTSTFEEGVAWLEERRGGRLPRLAELLVECKIEITKAGGPPVSRRPRGG